MDMAKKVILFIIIYLTAIACKTNAYQITRYPLDNTAQVRANYGQYRNWGTYVTHDGIDLGGGIKGQPVYPLADGIVEKVVSNETEGFGNYIIIRYDNANPVFSTLYGHLKDFTKIIHGDETEPKPLRPGDQVYTSQPIGRVGSTGKSTGPHLHLNIGTSALGGSQENPIAAGLPQPRPEDSKIIEYSEAAYYCNSFIRLLAPGNGDKFYMKNEIGNNQEVNYLEPDKPVRVVIEAYQNPDSQLYKTNPYGVEFTITKIGGTAESSYTIYRRFNKTYSEMNASVEAYYNFAKPWVTKNTNSSSSKDYYYVDWKPSAGLYIIQVKVYSAWYENGQVKFQDPPDTHERIVTVGLSGIDYPYDYYVAYNPNIPKETMAGAAAVKATAVCAPTIYYTDISNVYFSTSPNDPDFPRSTAISARADKDVNWKIIIFNSFNSEIKTLTGTGSKISQEWNGAGEGTYTYQVEAKDPSSDATAVEYGPASIKIDNTPPSISIKSDPTVYITTSEAKAFLSFSSNADLYTTVVDIVDQTGGPVIEYLATNPTLKKDEVMGVTWESAGQQPNGWYYFKITATDLAGNQTVKTVPVQVSLPGQPAPSDDAPDFSVVRLTPPEEVKNLVVGDVAFDNNDNMYVVYTNKLKVVKYDSAGKEVGKIESFNGEPLWYPLGLAVSPSDDRVYVADTYNNRVLIYDNNLNPINMLKGRDVFMERERIERDEYFLFIKTGHYSHNSDLELLEEGCLLPKDVFCNESNLFVTDSGKHRILKYDLAGKEILFDKIEGHHGENESNGCWHYTNSLNETKDIWHEYGKVAYPAYDNSDTMRYINAIIHKISADGFGYANGKFTSPESIAVDSSGYIYAADTGNHRIQKFAPDGSFVAKFGEGILNSPRGIDIDSYGSVWVADTGNQRIVQFNAIGEFVKEYKSDEYAINPQKIKVREGKIYIADANFNKPLVWNIGGELANVRVSSAWFSPSGNSTRGPLKISYNLSQPADVTIQLIPKTEPGITTLGVVGGIVLDKTSRNIGNNQEVWDGKLLSTAAMSASSTPEAAIPDGQYTLKISAAFGDYVKTKTVDINIDNTKPSLALNRDPPGISPNSDGIKDSLKIDYSLSDNLSPTAEVKLYLWKNGRILDVLLDRNRTLDKRTGTSPVPTFELSDQLNWNGKIGSYVIEGNYTLEARVADLAGNTATATQEVLVDFQPPRIEAVNVSNPFFSPNGDGRKDNTEIKFHLYDNFAGRMPVTILVENKDGAEAADIIRRRELSPGEYTFTWEGTADGGRLTADGEYKFKIYAEDSAGNLGRSEPAAVVVDTVPPSILNLAADPNPFTPNNDGVKDRTRFSYTLSEPCNAELKIFREESDQLFRDYRWHDVTSGNFTWDGSGFHGEIMGEEHPYHLYAEDRAGNITASETEIIVVDHTPSLVPYAFAEPDPFSPVNSRNSFTDIKYYLSRDGLTVNVAVVGKEGRVVKQLVNNEVQNKGEHSVRWNGSFDSSYDGPRATGDRNKVADGSWEFKVTATASDEPNLCLTSNTVLVDNVPPYIMAEPVDVDLAGRNATLRYSIPETASVEVSVFDSGNNLVAELENSTRNAGVYASTWNPATAISDLTYFKISAVDKARNQTERRTELFSVVPREDLQIIGLNAAPSTFTPNGDARADQTRISYRITGGVPDYRASVNILNSVGATVKRLIENETQSSSPYSFYWDGKTDSGQLAADGYYDYQVAAEDRLGTRVEGRGTVLLVSTRPTVNLSSSLPVFSPNGDGSKDTVTFSYSIGYPTFYITGEALVKIEVLNAAGEAVWSRVFNHTAGSYVYEYNGRTASGLPLPAGNYYVRASAEDALGTTAVPKTVSLQVDYNEPAVAIQSISPDPFSPNPNGVKDQTVISYTLAKPAYVTVKVKQGETVSKTLLSNQWTDAYVSGLSASKVKAFGIPTVTWNGRDEVGSFVADGTYAIEISAIDSAGNASTSSALITVDNTQPTIPMVDPLPANTNQGLQNITGTAESNSLVKVYINDNLASSGNASATGVFNIPTNLFAGANNLKLAATDAAGNTSDFSTEQLVIYETDAPIVSNLSVSPNPAKAGPVTIAFTVSETLESDPIVKINEETATLVPSSIEGFSRYEYTYNITGSDQQGPATVSIEAHDLAGNVSTFQTSNVLTIDTLDSTISNVDIDVEDNPRGTSSTAYAKLGSKVTVDFSVSEELLSDPIVHVGTGFIPVRETRTVYSSNRIDYRYGYTIGTLEVEGINPVSIEVTDLAGNVTSEVYNNLTIDRTSPEVSTPSYSANPARAGELTVSFNLSEPLKEIPKVYVKQNEGTWESASVSGSWSSGGRCEAKYEVYPSALGVNDGTTEVKVELIDLARNQAAYQLNDLKVDTVSPVFTGINCEVSNPVFTDFTKHAKDGSEITITFNASEALPFNPDVRVNDRLASYDSQFSNEYRYRYTLRAGEVDLDRENNRLAEISISGDDSAGNRGEVATSSEAESFTIDLTRPTVTITENRDMIAEPSPFSTNASSEAGHRQTRLRYEISEYGSVTLSIHKVPNTQEVYSRSDFNDDNRVVSFNEGWLGAGEHFKYWNGAIQYNQSAFDRNSNGFADPGKYAFIIEVKDRAGNIIEGKWGGTCWIQDNVLVLGQPDRTEIGGDNPRPRFFSPNGDGNLDSTTVWFRVKLGVTPAEAPRPERIGVMAIPSDFAWVAGKKLIGSYTVRVWNENKTTLIRTIVRDVPLDSNIILYETWDGRNDAGSYVPEGNYKIEIDARDFIGGQAENNLLTLTVTVDKTAPRVVDNESGTADTTPWRNGKDGGGNPITYAYNVDFFDNGAFDSKLDRAEYKIGAGGSWNPIFSDLNSTSYNTDWGQDVFGGCAEGTNIVYVRALDKAGNWSTETLVFYVKKDTGEPSANAPIVDRTPTNNKRPTWNWTESSDMSGIAGYYVKLGTSAGADNITNETWISNITSWSPGWDLNDGQIFASIKVKDNAGNLSAWASSSTSVIIDSQPPSVSRPGNVSFNNPNFDSIIRIDFAASDPLPTSGFSVFAKIIYTFFDTQTIRDLNVRGSGGDYYVEWDARNNDNDFVNEGNYTLVITATDEAGNYTTEASTITLQDDQRITDNSADSNSPYLTISGNTLTLKWIEGGLISQGTEEIEAKAGPTKSNNSTSSGLIPFTIYYGQTVTFTILSWPDNSISEHKVFDNNGNLIDSWYCPGCITATKYLEPGDYKLEATVSSTFGNVVSAYTRVKYSYRKYNQSSQISDDLGNIWGIGPTMIVGQLPNPNQTVEQIATYDGAIKHKVKVTADWFGYHLKYSRSYNGGTSWTSETCINHLTNKASCRNNTMFPTITADSNNDAYVAWTDFRDAGVSSPQPGVDNYEIYFQKIPYDFAPAEGTRSGYGFSVKVNSDIVATQSATLELPTLLSPADGVALDTRRPNFEWKAPKAAYKDYKLLWAKGGRFDSLDLTDKGESPLRQENIHGTTKSADPTHVYFGYTIPYIDPALEQFTPSSPTDYSWKVTAVTSLDGTAVTSEVRTFRCEPDLEMSGITNWPNPFNPNKPEITKIRYKLSKDADEVKIRIYDITGSLVIELDGDTQGEGTSMLTKYNDVDWNGRNGRGDMVMNGIYPFEIVARSGDKSVSGRGKIAVLK